MGIDPFLTGQAFDPQAVREMTLALQSVCNGLCVSTDDEETTRLVAEKIVELAGHGMRGATLHATAIKELEAHRAAGDRSPWQIACVHRSLATSECAAFYCDAANANV